MPQVKGNTNTTHIAGAAIVHNDIIMKNGKMVGQVRHGTRRREPTFIVDVPPWPPVTIPDDNLNAFNDVLAVIPQLLNPAPAGISNPQRVPPIESAPAGAAGGGKHGNFVHVGLHGPMYHGN